METETMANPSPNLATRFQPGYRGPGRPPVGWLRDVMSEEKGGITNREKIARHLIEIATSWEVKVIGKGADGEVLKVASGSDAVQAARILYSYDIGKPRVSDQEFALMLANHFQQVARDQVEIGLKLLGNQLQTMSDEAKAAFWNRCERDPRRFLEAAQEELAARAANDLTCSTQVEQLSPAPESSKDDPSPKDRDMADHGHDAGGSCPPCDEHSDQADAAETSRCVGP